MKTQKVSNNEVAIYQAKTGAIELAVDTKRETFLLTQQQVAEIFDVQKAAISKHVKNIFDSGELKEKATVSILETVQKEGKREIVRKIEYYNLDLVLSIGYRVNSAKATKFRQWATKTLRAHIVDGYTINKARIAQDIDVYREAIANIKKLLPAGTTIDTSSILELVTLFADTWLSLDAYDKDTLVTKGATKKSVKITATTLAKAISVLKQSLIEKDEATDLFATERERGSIAGIVGNVMQSLGGSEVYPSIEEKAAHLLYYLIKNHPFVDGNKRSGAYAFIWFLRQAKILDTTRITPPALTAITLLVAGSDPKDKERMTRLILTMLAQGKKK